MTDDSLSRDTFNTPSFLAISDYDSLEQNTDGHNTLETNLNSWTIYNASQLSKKTGLQAWHNLIKLRHARRPVFLLDRHQIRDKSRKIGIENKSWIHAVENYRSIFDDLEL